jgi:hypothetical protein
MGMEYCQIDWFGTGDSVRFGGHRQASVEADREGVGREDIGGAVVQAVFANQGQGHFE